MKNNKCKHIIALFAVLCVTIPHVLFAETVLRTGENVSVEAEQTVEGDYYVSVGPVGKTVMSGSVLEDMLAFGASIVVNGAVGEDVLLLGGTVDVLAPVGGDVRVAAGEVVISQTVGGDVFVFGGTTAILSTATIEGDVFVFGGSAVIEGDVQGSVYGKVEQMNINATVAGAVDVYAPAGLTLSEKAVIKGDVSYGSMRTIVRSPQAVIEGAIHEKPKEVHTSKDQLRSVLVPLFIVLFTVLSLYLLGKTHIQSVVEEVQAKPAKSMLLGLGLLLLGPIAAVLLLVSVIGMFVGIVTLSLLIALYVVALALSGAIFGIMIARIFDKRAPLSLPIVVLGTVLLYGAVMIPVLGVFLVVVLVSTTLGSMGLLVYKHFA